MRKLVFFDIDGTIISEDDHTIPDSTRNAITALRRNGHYTFINTGRTSMNVRDDIRCLGFDGYLCGCGTELLYQDQVLAYHTLDKALCERIADEVAACGAAPLYERRDAMFVDTNARSLPKQQELLALYETQGVPVLLRQEHESDFSYDKFVIWYDEKTDMERFRRCISGLFDYIDRGPGFAEFPPAGFSKATAMSLLIEQLNRIEHTSFTLADTVAIGDSLNDQQMLEAAGVGVAMGNGTLLHPFADLVTKDLKADGLAYAMKTLDLI